MLRIRIDEIAEAEECPMLTFDGFDEAIIGYGGQSGQDPCFIYDYDKILDILITKDSMSLDDAVDYLEYNLIKSYLGEGTPIISRKD